MAHLGSDGRPFSPQDIERLREALVSLSLDCLEVPPEVLNAKRLRAWHAQLSAGLERMQPGHYRTQPITFGSLAGLDAARIAPAVGQMLSRHHQLVRRWDSPDQEAVLRHATSLHAELIRIHPFWDGNGRLARLVQAWVCWRYGFHAPQYRADQRPAYHSALSRYCLYADLEPLMALTWASLPPA